MKKSLAVCSAFAASLCFAEVNDWENLSVNSINREAARTYSMPLADESAAFTDAIEPETPYKMSLRHLEDLVGGQSRPPREGLLPRRLP